MGTIIHTAAIVTSWNVEHVANARAVAGQSFGAVSGIVPSGINGYWSFFIASSGSKLGWEPETTHREKLAAFEKAVTEKGWYLEIAFVRYGEMDEGPVAYASAQDFQKAVDRVPK